METSSCTVPMLFFQYPKAKSHVSEIEQLLGTTKLEGEARASIKLLLLWTFGQISWNLTG